MVPSSWQREISGLKRIIHFLYLSPLVLVGISFFLLPSVGEAWRNDLGIVFYGLTAAAALSFLFAMWMHSQIMSQETLEMRSRGVGFYAAVSAFRTGVILCASLGDFCATLAIVSYFISRNPLHLAMIMAIWALHYRAGVVWLRRGEGNLTVLAARFPSQPSSVDEVA